MHNSNFVKLKEYKLYKGKNKERKGLRDLDRAACEVRDAALLESF